MPSESKQDNLNIVPLFLLFLDLWLLNSLGALYLCFYGGFLNIREVLVSDDLHTNDLLAQFFIMQGSNVAIWWQIGFVISLLN